jgi:hypothetical protein
MQHISSLFSVLYPNMFRASIFPSSGEKCSELPRMMCSTVTRDKNREVWCCGDVCCGVVGWDYRKFVVWLYVNQGGVGLACVWILTSVGLEAKWVGFFGAGRSMRVLWFVFWGLPMGKCKWREMGQVLVGNVDCAGWWE